MADIDVFYYTLKKDKITHDGHRIDEGQELIRIPLEDAEFFLFETFDNSPIKKIFWAKPDDVKFIRKQTENWSKSRIEQRRKELEGDWL